MKIHDVVQGSEEWHELRRRRATASHATAIGNCGKGLDTYIYTLMADYYSLDPEQGYSNNNMLLGNELENEASIIYELETGNKCFKEGFCEYNEYVGCSVDRLVNENGLAEIKYRTDKVYFEYLLDRKIPSSVFWQMQMQMLIREKDWCDYVVYNPNYFPCILIEKVYPNEIHRTKLLNGFKRSEELILEIEEKYKKAKKII